MRSHWLVSPRFDLGVFVLPALASVALAAVSSKLGGSDGDMPAWAYLVFVLGVDVAHVHATSVRVYFDPAELHRRSTLYLLVPLLGFGAGSLAYHASPLFFWRALAYLAAFHFMRQQIGWLRLYRRRAGEQGVWDARLDEAALYLCMLYPLCVWHARLPTPFQWFMPGDFLRGLPAWVANASGALCALVLALFLARQWQRRARDLPVSAGKLLLLATTASTWWSGIVLFQSDFAFTVTNVVAHGVPYAAMAWRVGRAPGPQPRAAWQRWLFAHAPRYVLLLLALAYVEEWLWDASVWREHASLFPAPALDLEAWAALLVPLLTLPQLTHYVLDAYLWRLDGQNPGLAAALGVEVDVDRNANALSCGPAQPWPDVPDALRRSPP